MEKNPLLREIFGFHISQFLTARLVFVDETLCPTQVPTQIPSQVPTQVPTQIPSQVPTQVPTQTPSQGPTHVPTQTPSQVPTHDPTQIPTQVPTQVPTQIPSQGPTHVPTQIPSQVPTQVPTQIPSQFPTQVPTQSPSQVPTQTPTDAPTEAPTIKPSAAPSRRPSLTPTLAPSGVTAAPTFQSETILGIKSFYQLMRKANSNAPLEDADIRAVRQAVAKEGGVDVKYTKYVGSTESSVIPGMVADSIEVGDESEEESGGRVNTRRRGVRGVLKGLERDGVVTSSFLRGEDVLPAREEIPRHNQYQHPDLHLTSPTKTFVLQVDLELPLVDFPVYQGNATALCANLTQTLQRSISSGSFLSTLLSEAGAEGATVITAENVTGVHQVDFSAPLFAFPPTLAPSQHPRHDDSWLGDGAVVGLVIGPILGLLLLMMVVYGSIVRMRELRK
eukprot:gene11146-12425_t